MRYQRAIPLGLAFAILCGWAAVAQLSAQEAAVPGDPFDGKILLVYKKSDPEFSLTLEKARVTALGDVSFLVGLGVEDGVEENWQAGRSIWVALSDISEINLFDSLEELQDATEGMLGLKVASGKRGSGESGRSG